jgi:hypothetical protein
MDLNYIMPIILNTIINKRKIQKDRIHNQKKTKIKSENKPRIFRSIKNEFTIKTNKMSEIIRLVTKKSLLGEIAKRLNIKKGLTTEA